MNEQVKTKYEEVSNHLIALGKVWVDTFQKKGLYITLKRRWIAYKAFKAFRWFIDLKDEDEYIYATLFFVSTRDDLAVMDMIDYGFRRAQKKGEFLGLKVTDCEMGDDGKLIKIMRDATNIFDYLFYRWPVLGQIE